MIKDFLDLNIRDLRTSMEEINESLSLIQRLKEEASPRVRAEWLWHLQKGNQSVLDVVDAVKLCLRLNAREKELQARAEEG